jgi:tRNA1Val (adenine37-N6)-methyltransferase
MANSYFQFKQFRIEQAQCAMKVCTDACILGAWFAAKLGNHSYVLDVGSGTGLLMMMLAQQSESEIHGIEINLDCFKQLKENISQNEWKQRLQVFPGDVRQCAFPVKYDFIISNPPFFENDLPSASAANQVARHSNQLTLSDLVEVFDNNLQPSGSVGVLLPYHRWEYFDALARQHHFYCTEKLFVRQSPWHDPFRAILHYSRHEEHYVPSYELIIQDKNAGYTAEFTELMKPYYLYL